MKNNTIPAMKKYFAIICLAMAAIACSKESVTETHPEAEGVRTVTLTATLPSTKVNVDLENNGKVTWSSDDKIAVYNNDGKKFIFTIKAGAGTSNATFNCSTFSGTLNDIAVYPAEWAGDSPGDIVIPEYIERSDNIPAVMASTINSGDSGDDHEIAPLYFKSLMFIMEFTLKDLPAYACAFKLWSQSGAQLNGTYTINASRDALESVPVRNACQIIYFPYKTAYGSDATVKVYAAIPAYEYKDLRIRVLDGDEDVIEGTSKLIPARYFKGQSADAYITMEELNISSMVGDSRKDFIKVEGVKWAKGNLRVKQEESYEDGWQAGFNIFDNQYETVYASQDQSSVNYTHSTTYYDVFNWGGLGRTTRYGNSGFITQTDAGNEGIERLDISGKIFSRREGTFDELQESILSGDAQFAYWNVFAGYDGGKGNPNIYGDVAYWASKGKYRMPTNNEIVTLRAAVDKQHANAEACYYMLGDVRIDGILLTSTPSWVESTLITTSRELTEADLESGLFLPKTGRREQGVTNCKVVFANAQGYYWSSTFGKGGSNSSGVDCSTSATIIGWRAANTCDYGYTFATNNNKPNGAVSGGLPIRPVLIK